MADPANPSLYSALSCIELRRGSKESEDCSAVKACREEAGFYALTMPFQKAVVPVGKGGADEGRHNAECNCLGVAERTAQILGTTETIAAIALARENTCGPVTPNEVIGLGPDTTAKVAANDPKPIAGDIGSSADTHDPF